MDSISTSNNWHRSLCNLSINFIGFFLQRNNHIEQRSTAAATPNNIKWNILWCSWDHIKSEIYQTIYVNWPSTANCVNCCIFHRRAFWWNKKFGSTSERSVWKTLIANYELFDCYIYLRLFEEKKVWWKPHKRGIFFKIWF